MLIYVDYITERQIFTFDFIFKRNDVEYSLTNDIERFESYSGEKINYSDKEIDNVLQFPPALILFEENIDLEIEKNINEFSWRNTKLLAFYKIPDPFASIFYFLSDYTNYLNKEKDEHHRASAKTSLAYNLGCLEICVVDRWIEAIFNYLKFKNFELELPAANLNFKSTFDIDNTFAYKYKDGLRGKLSLLKDYLYFNTKRIAERKSVNANKTKDPYDTFDYIKGLAENNIEVIVFYLLGDFTKYDRNLSFEDLRHKKHISELSKMVKVALHPSYKSNGSKTQLLAEKKRLESIIEKDVIDSRQHFLKVRMPKTYQDLIALGFENDYSCGYADAVGFRLGTANTVPFFNLQKNQTTSLNLFPFAYMDGTLNQYLKKTPEQAKQIINDLYKEVSKHGGNFISIWHNETIGDYGIWKGWKEVYQYMIDLHCNHEKNSSKEK